MEVSCVGLCLSCDDRKFFGTNNFTILDMFDVSKDNFFNY